MQYWPILDTARIHAAQAFQSDFIYDQPQTFLDALAEAHATLQDQFGQDPSTRDYWTARNAVDEILFRTAMWAQDGDHGDYDPETEAANPTYPIFLHAVGESATVWETENPQYNHWDDFDAELTTWRETLATEYALEPAMRDRVNIQSILESIGAAACMFASHARFTKHDRDPHTRENYAVWQEVDGEWTIRDNHCDAGFEPVAPDFVPNQPDETICLACQEYAYGPPPAAMRSVPVPEFRIATPYHALARITDEAGVITGANATHWPCLAATALTLNRYRIPLAIADHGLTHQQRHALDRFQVTWIDHPKPRVPKAMPPAHAVAPQQAYWKPWICLASPWQRSLWIDADAIALTHLPAALDLQHPEPLLTSNDKFTLKSHLLYREFHRVANLCGPVPDSDTHATIVNTGVLAWTHGEPLINEWRDATQELIDRPHYHALANCRDQSTMYAVLARRQHYGAPLPYYLPHSWNWPADGLPAPSAGARKRLPVDPYKLLAVTLRRHPQTHIVHWLGLPKPNDLYPKTT